MTSCIFCDIIAKRLDPELTAFEHELAIVEVSLQQKPGNHGHMLVIPKAHIETIYDLSEELGGPLMSTLRLAARGVKRAFDAEGVHIRQNNELGAGQDVPHLHFHVIPRYRDDAFEAKQYERLSIEARREQAERLRAAMRIELGLRFPS